MVFTEMYISAAISAVLSIRDAALALAFGERSMISGAAVRSGPWAGTPSQVQTGPGSSS
jgi:hypothetical protein